MPKVPLEHKRKRFFATEQEQALILWLREYGWNPAINQSIGKAVGYQLEMLERQEEYMKQEGQDATKEFAEIVISIGLLKALSARWRELMKEIVKK